MSLESLSVYCEKRPFGEEAAAILDVQDVRDLQALPGVAWDAEDERSLLEFEVTYKKYGQLREGTWYQLPIKRLELEFVSEDSMDRSPAESSALMRGKLRSGVPVRGSEFRIKPAFADHVRADAKWTDKIRRPGDDLEMVVASCGQGNWNEILSDEVRILYDTGCSYHWNRNQVRTFLDSRALGREQREVHVIISHWDVDHYHALLHAENQELKVIRSIVGPDRAPRTATCRRFMSRMTGCGVPVFLAPPAAPLPGDGRVIHLHETSRSGPLRLFRATRGSVRNQTGIVTVVEGHRRTAILTGDHNHEKVLLAVQRSKPKLANAEYVVPHHGGRAGEFVASEWAKTVRSMAAIVSYGANNPYHHPFSDVVRSVETVAGRQLHRTPVSGSYRVTL